MPGSVATGSVKDPAQGSSRGCGGGARAVSSAPPRGGARAAFHFGIDQQKRPAELVIPARASHPPARRTRGTGPRSGGSEIRSDPPRRAVDRAPLAFKNEGAGLGIEDLIAGGAGSVQTVRRTLRDTRGGVEIDFGIVVHALTVQPGGKASPEPAALHADGVDTVAAQSRCPADMLEQMVNPHMFGVRLVAELAGLEAGSGSKPASRNRVRFHAERTPARGVHRPIASGRRYAGKKPG